MTYRDLGLRWSLRDLLAGITVAVAAYFSYFIGYGLIYSAHHAIVHTAAQTGSTARQIFGHPSFLSIPLVILNPFFEELIVRAYLMKEIRELTGSWLLAGAASVAVQTTYHLYYGWVGALSLSFQFAFFSVYYAKSQKATPIVVAHGIFDAWGMLRLLR